MPGFNGVKFQGSGPRLRLPPNCNSCWANGVMSKPRGLPPSITLHGTGEFLSKKETTQCSVAILFPQNSGYICSKKKRKVFFIWKRDQESCGCLPLNIWTKHQTWLKGMNNSNVAHYWTHDLWICSLFNLSKLTWKTIVCDSENG